jgi:hypothetical protein
MIWRAAAWRAFLEQPSEWEPAPRVTESTAASPSRRARAFTLYPFLFAAYPVLFLWSQNLGETNAGDVLPLLAIVLAVTAVAMVVLTLIFRDARRAALIVAPIAVAILMYGHLLIIMRPFHVRPLLQQAAWVVLVGLGMLGALRLPERPLRRVSGALNGISAILVIVALVGIVPYQVTAATSAQVAPPQAVTGGASQRPLRDVYYLILDRYGSDEALSLRYGIDNDLTPWLADHGFRVLNDSNANYVRTTLSIASTLNMVHLTDLAARLGADSRGYGPMYDMLQDSRIVKQFKALGYRYTHIGSYFSPTRSDAGADRDLYIGGPSDFGATLFDTSALPRIFRALHIEGLSRAERLYANKVFGFKALDSVRDDPGPKFVFAHILLPHPPYLITRDGQFRDAAAAAQLSDEEQFGDQLAWTNDQLRAWIESLQALPEDRRPIIILQADEGPYPRAYGADTTTYDWSTASPRDLLIKYGILNAWYLPDGTDPGLYDSMTSVNTFPTLFSGYFGLDVPRLEDRVYTSARPGQPLNLTDITDRLESAQP